MSDLRRIISVFIEGLNDALLREPDQQDSSIYLKHRPDVLQPGQVWRARPLSDWTEQNRWVEFNFVLSYVSEQQDYCKGFLLIDGLNSSVLKLADRGDVKLPIDVSPIDDAFIAVWRGEVNLAPAHLKSYYGDVPEFKFRKMMDNYVPILTFKKASPQQNPELRPVRDILWRLTECFDAEALLDLPD